MEDVIIKVNPGSRMISNDDEAGEVGRALFSMEETYGSVSPEMVVQAANDEDSVLHRFFTWDDTKAALEYRLEQARRLLRSVSVVRREDPRGPQVRMFVNVGRSDAGDKESRYVSTQRAMREPALRESVLSQVNHDLQALRRKHHDLHELASVWNAVDQLSIRVSEQLESAV